MKICIMNGNPKTAESTSDLLIEYLTSFLKGNEVVTYNVCKTDFSQVQFSQIQSSNVLIFAFPLYIDSVNSGLLRFLIELENRGFSNKNSTVYCMINNGFYEGWQNHVAAEIMRNWCKAVGLTYGPYKNIGIALEELSHNILCLNRGEDLYISPNWPRFLWKIVSSYSFWYPKAKKNGLKRRRLNETVD